MPKDAEFGIRIGFKPGEAQPQRLFRAADAMISALQQLDRALCAAVDNRIETVMVLEEIEAGSFVVWLRNLLQRADDEAIKTLEWKPLVGRYLVKAKYAYIRWSNKEDGARTIVDLAKEIREIAIETDIKHLPDYAPPSISALANSVRTIESAKSFLIEGDTISYVVPDEPPVDFDMGVRWEDEELEKMAIKETVKSAGATMILIVKKPDYLGKSKWEFRQGGKQISATVGDEQWLPAFQARKIDVRPGDALRCLVDIEHHYGYDNELVSESFFITKVLEVIENQLSQGSLSFDGGLTIPQA